MRLLVFVIDRMTMRGCGPCAEGRSSKVPDQVLSYSVSEVLRLMSVAIRGTC
jgi:hypothetical protein